jgi:hypothetical protein
MGTQRGEFVNGAYTLGLNSAMSTMAQEVGHRWMVFMPFFHPTTNSFSSDLLGRDFAHWSFMLNARVPVGQFGGDARASSMEGNAILDLGPGASAEFPSPCNGPGESTFLTEPNELTDGFTELDQYLMGLRKAGDVSPFWYIDEPRSPFDGSSLEGARFFPAVDDSVGCGIRVDLTVGNIQAVGNITGLPAFGPRFPEIGDEIDIDQGGTPQDDVKTMAFILLLEQGPVNAKSNKAAIKRVDTFRRTWDEYGNGPATAGLGRFDTTLNPPIH